MEVFQFIFDCWASFFNNVIQKIEIAGVPVGSFFIGIFLLGTFISLLTFGVKISGAEYRSDARERKTRYKYEPYTLKRVSKK